LRTPDLLLLAISSVLSQPPLLSHFLKLRAEHIHASIGVKVADRRDVKPVSLPASRWQPRSPVEHLAV